MFKRWASYILILVVVLSAVNVFADVQQAPETYDITVTEQGGKYNLDNVQLIFKKDSMEVGMQPVTFKVALYADHGVPYIDIEPSVEKFARNVTIKVQKGNIQLFDIATNEVITVQLDNNHLKVAHFSRYILID